MDRRHAASLCVGWAPAAPIKTVRYDEFDAFDTDAPSLQCPGRNHGDDLSRGVVDREPVDGMNSYSEEGASIALHDHEDDLNAHVDVDCVPGLRCPTSWLVSTAQPDHIADLIAEAPGRP